MSIATKSKSERFVFFIFLAAFLVRMIYVFQVLQFPLTEYLVSSNTFDQHGFDNRALFIVSGNWLGGSEVFVKEPLYPYFLALIYRTFGYSHFAVYLMQSLLTSIGVLLLYKISPSPQRRIFVKAVAGVAVADKALRVPVEPGVDTKMITVGIKTNYYQ